MADPGMHKNDKVRQPPGQAKELMGKGQKGHGQGGQSGKIQNGQNMQRRDGRH